MPPVRVGVHMKTTIAAVEFGTCKIVTVVAQSGGLEKCDIAGSGTVAYDGYLPEGWNDPDGLKEKVRESIRAAEADSGMHIDEVYVGVPGAFTFVRSGEAEIELGEEEIGDDEMNGVQDCVADRLQIIEEGGFVLHRSPAWFSVDGGRHTMAPLGMKGHRLAASTSFIIAKMDFIRDMTDLFGELGITILGFLSPTLGEALLLLSLEERDRSALLIDVGYLNTEISGVLGDAIVYHEVLPLGGGHITAEIATDLQIPMRAAEQLKRLYVFNADDFDGSGKTDIRGPGGRKITFTREEVSGPAERQMKELCSMIENTVRQRAGACLESRGQIFLTGGGIAMMRGAREYLSKALGRPVRLAQVKSAKMNSPIFASAMGLVDLVFDSIEQQEESSGSAGKFHFPLFKKG